MADYPQTVLEFNDRFHDDVACRAYLNGHYISTYRPYPRRLFFCLFFCLCGLLCLAPGGLGFRPAFPGV